MAILRVLRNYNSIYEAACLVQCVCQSQQLIGAKDMQMIEEISLDISFH